MPSWKDGEESSEEEELVGMDLEQHWANPGTTIDASFCGRAADASITCRLHLAPCMKYVAFEGKDTGRRFYGCVVPQLQESNYMEASISDGIDCGVAQWVDATWPSILQRCLVKIWEMFHEENHGRMIDHEKYKKELDKVNKQLDTLGDQYSQLVEGVTKMFDWADQNNRVMSDEEFKQKQMDVDKDMEKLAISKEKESADFGKMKEMEKLAQELKEMKCILRS
ncbi:uncharacterized protein [Aegilops tauschii subsp. strangulata]|uniref:uncharacterized protein n=1 Tax=Aegilops tauschii subsp. strangulata TaxID=200361 RepID=UPI00098A266A